MMCAYSLGLAHCLWQPQSPRQRAWIPTPARVVHAPLCLLSFEQPIVRVHGMRASAFEHDPGFQPMLLLEVAELRAASNAGVVSAHLCCHFIVERVWRGKLSAVFCAASAPAGHPQNGESVATHPVTRSPMNISPEVPHVSRERRKPALNTAFYKDALSTLQLITTAAKNTNSPQKKFPQPAQNSGGHPPAQNPSR